MMAANYRHIGGLENRLGRHYSRFSASGPAVPLAAQSLAWRKSSNGRSNRRSQASTRRFVATSSDRSTSWAAAGPLPTARLLRRRRFAVSPIYLQQLQRPYRGQNYILPPTCPNSRI